jgi:hypothetical protein
MPLRAQGLSLTTRRRCIRVDVRSETFSKHKSRRVGVLQTLGRSENMMIMSRCCRRETLVRFLQLLSLLQGPPTRTRHTRPYSILLVPYTVSNQAFGAHREEWNCDFHVHLRPEHVRLDDIGDLALSVCASDILPSSSLPQPCSRLPPRWGIPLPFSVQEE